MVRAFNDVLVDVFLWESLFQTAWKATGGVVVVVVKHFQGFLVQFQVGFRHQSI